MAVKKGDIVKFFGNVEPCIIYRVIDPNEQMMETAAYGILTRIVPHIRIEAIGFVPTEFLESVTGHPENIYALDNMLALKHQLN